MPPPANSSVDAPALCRIGELEQQVQDLQRKLDRQRAANLRQALDIERWRKIAQETAEQLWISGQRAARHTDRPTAAARRQAVVETLNDPAGRLLSDREIARRTGVPVSTVAYWRWRVAIDRRRRSPARPCSRRGHRPLVL